MKLSNLTKGILGASLISISSCLWAASSEVTEEGMQLAAGPRQHAGHKAMHKKAAKKRVRRRAGSDRGGDRERGGIRGPGGDRERGGPGGDRERRGPGGDRERGPGANTY